MIPKKIILPIIEEDLDIISLNKDFIGYFVKL